MNDIDHFLTLSLFPSHFAERIFYWDAFAEEENVIKMAAPYSKERLTLFTMYASASPLAVRRKRPQSITNGEYNCSNGEPKLC